METLESSMKMNHVTSLSSSFKSRTYREEYFTIFSFLQMKCQPDAEKSHQLLIQNNFFHNLVQVYRIVLQMFKREVIYELSSVFIGREMSRKRKHNRKHFTITFLFKTSADSAGSYIFFRSHKHPETTLTKGHLLACFKVKYDQEVRISPAQTKQKLSFHYLFKNRIMNNNATKMASVITNKW